MVYDMMHATPLSMSIVYPRHTYTRPCVQAAQTVPLLLRRGARHLGGQQAARHAGM